MRNRARIADINAQIEDNLSGIRVVKSFANEEIELEKFKRGNDRFIDSKRESYRYMGLYHSGLGAFTTLISVIVIGVGAVFITKDTLQLRISLLFCSFITILPIPYAS